MDKKTRKIMMPILEGVLKIATTVEIESNLESFVEAMEKMPINKLTTREKKRMMKVVFSHAKNTAISFFDERLAELEAKQ